MLPSLRKYGLALLLLVPLFWGTSIQHSAGVANLAAIPVEQSESENRLNSLSEMMEETSKEDDIHIHYTSYLPEGNKFSGGTLFGSPGTRIVILIPSPPPDLVWLTLRSSRSIPVRT